MPALADLRVVRSVTVKATPEGVDQTAAALGRLSDAQDKVASTAGRMAAVTDTVVGKAGTVAGSFDRLVRSLDPVARAQDQLERGTRTVTRAFEQGEASIAERDRALAMLQSRYDNVAGAAERAAERDAAAQRRIEQASGQRAQRSVESQTITPDRGADIAAYGAELDRLRAKFNPLYAAGREYKETLVEISQAAKVGAISENERAAAVAKTKDAFKKQVETIDNASKSIGLQRHEWINLSRQMQDVVTMGAMGASPMQIASSQGAQVFDIFSSSKNGATSALREIVGFITPARVAMAGLTAAVVLGATAAYSYASGQKEVETSLRGVGAASGATLQQVNDVAGNFAGAGRVSVSTARGMASQFASTGKIGADMFGSLIKTADPLARVLGIDVADATAMLAKSFADPTKGAVELTERLGFLDAQTEELIRRQQASGNMAGAQRTLFDAFSRSVDSQVPKVGVLTRAWNAVWNAASNGYDALGRGLTDTSRMRLGLLEKNAPYDPEIQRQLTDERNRGAMNQVVAQMNAQLQRRSVKMANESRAVEAIVQDLNPERRRLEDIEDRAKRISTFLKDGGIDKDGSSKRAMEALERSGAQLRRDMAAGGAEFADGVRRAEEALRTSGFSPLARAVAENNQRAEERRLKVEREGGDPELRTARLASIEKERLLEEARLRQEARVSETQSGGAFSRLSESLQQQVQATAEQFGRIPASIIAAIIAKESGGRVGTGFSQSLGEDGRPSSAYGLGQITAGAERDIRANRLPGFDRTDPNQQVAGVGAYLDILLQRRGGDLAAAVGDYYGSKDLGLRSKYVAGVYREAGMAGDTSTLGTSRELDANARALENQNRLVDLNSQYLGRNGERLDAATRAQQLLADAQARGVPLSQALREEFDKTASGMASAARRLSVVKFGDDISFERQQLGRTAQDQSVYARVRGIFGDTDTPAARMAIDQARLNDNLRTAKDLTTDFARGFGADIANATKPMDALARSVDRLKMKLLDMAIEGLVSKAFGGLIGGSGSTGGGLLSSFGKWFGLGGSSGGASASSAPLASTNGFGLSDGGWTGPGGKFEPAGIVHRGEFVFSARAVDRIGLSNLDALHRGYAVGGYVDSSPKNVTPSFSAANANVAPVVNNNVHNYGGAQVETQQSRGSNGEINIDTVVRVVEPRLAQRAAVGRGDLRDVMRNEASGGAANRYG